MRDIGIPNVRMSCEGVSDTTAADGRYNLQTTARANCAIIPTKTDAPKNGITTFDIVLAQKHILNIEPFQTPYEYIAADVNASGTVTGFDMVLMRKMILGIIDTFDVVPTWQFIPSDYEFPDGDYTNFPTQLPLDQNRANRSDVDFIGIKTGDINASVIEP